MNESTSQIIEKIKKLLSLANNHANLNEAIAAAGKAQALMVKYNLTMEMIEETTGRKRESEIVDSFRDQRRFMNKMPISDWAAVLASSLCEASHCACYITTVHHDMVSYKAASPQRMLSVVGFEEDVEFVLFVYDWLVSEIDRLVILNGSNQTNDWKESFRLGACKKVSERFRESRKDVENELKVLLEDKGETNKAQFAIIALDSRINKIEEHMKEIDLRKGENKQVGPGGLDAFKIGYKKADEVDLLNQKKIAENSKITLLN